MTINKDLEDIYLERLNYLPSADELLEQFLENQYNIIPEKSHINKSRNKRRK